MSIYKYIIISILFFIVGQANIQGQEGEEFDGVTDEEGRMAMQMARERIEQHRKGDFIVKLVDQDGNPVSGKVIVKQTEHEFAFGAAISPTLLYTSDEVKQTALSIVEELFNTVTINCMWGLTQASKGGPHDFSATDQHLAWAQQRGMKVRGHALLYMNEWFAPYWRDEVSSTEEWWQQIDQHFKAKLEHYGDEISDWNFGNEFIWYDNWVKDNIPQFPKLNDPGTMRRLYDIGRKYAPEQVKLVYNDQFVPSSYPDNHVFFDYMKLMRDYAASGEGFDKVGYQGHFMAHKSKTSFLQGDWAAGPDAFHMREIDKGLDSLSSLNLPVVITEFSPPSRDSRWLEDYPNQPRLTDEYVAAWAKNFYTLAFSKPYIEEISCWFVVDGISGGMMDAGFVRKDGSIKPLYDTIKKIIRQDWMTTETRNTVGAIPFRGFYGTYEVQVPGYKPEQVNLLRDSTNNPVVVMEIAKKKDNAFLGAITWPDKSLIMEGWNGDTIPGFTPTETLYQVILPYGTKNVPALAGIPQDINASIAVSRATHLNGSQDKRTTTFTVTAEDDSRIMEYTVEFNMEESTENKQLYQAEPFFSEVHAAKDGGFEIVNVGNVPLDLSGYLIGHSHNSLNPLQLIEAINSPPVNATNNIPWRYSNGYVPGYKFSDDTTDYLATPGILYPDSLVDPVIDPGDVFVLGQPVHRDWANEDAMLEADVITNYGSAWLTTFGKDYNSWGVTNLGSPQMGLNWDALYLFRIDNDSILDGTKEVWEDPYDYTLIDAVGNPETPWQEIQIGEHKRVLGWTDNCVFRRKPHIYQGNIAMDSTSNIAEWLSNSSKQDDDFSFSMTYSYYGSHTFDPVTIHLSTIRSEQYQVSEGYDSTQSIQADFGDSTSVETFLANIEKAVAGQALFLVDAISGSLKDLSAPVAGGDTLRVESPYKKNITNYILINHPLDSNALLSTVNSPSIIVIDTSGDQGLIKGVEYGDYLYMIIDSLVVPEKATLNIFDQHGIPVPMKVLNYDALYVFTRINDSIYVEVLAQDGSTKITYKFDPSAQPDDAFVISSVYKVDNDSMTISDIAIGSNVSLFRRYIEIVKGASATLVDPAGIEKTSGKLCIGDSLIIVSADQSVRRVYALEFLDGESLENNKSPDVSLAFIDTILMDILEIDLLAIVDDDGLPYCSNLSCQWTVIEGETDSVSFSDANSAATAVAFASTGNYTLQVMVHDGEKYSVAEVAVSVTSSVGISYIEIPAFKMYPIPATEIITIELEKAEGCPCDIQIIDITGKSVFSGKILNSSKNINVSHLKTGIYFVMVQSEKYCVTQRLNVIR